MTERRLLTIPISHYCEKARWALERAGLAYREERHVQGVNRIVSRRAGGHGTLPVLICEVGVLAESEAILRYADAHLPAERAAVPGRRAGGDRALPRARRRARPRRAAADVRPHARRTRR